MWVCICISKYVQSWRSSSHLSCMPEHVYMWDLDTRAHTRTHTHTGTPISIGRGEKAHTHTHAHRHTCGHSNTHREAPKTGWEDPFRKPEPGLGGYKGEVARQSEPCSTLEPKVLGRSSHAQAQEDPKSSPAGGPNELQKGGRRATTAVAGFQDLRRPRKRQKQGQKELKTGDEESQT